MNDILDALQHQITTLRGVDASIGARIDTLVQESGARQSVVDALQLVVRQQAIDAFVIRTALLAVVESHPDKPHLRNVFETFLQQRTESEQTALDGAKSGLLARQSLAVIQAALDRS